MDDLISKADVCEIIADIYPTDGEKVVGVKKIDRAYDAILALPYAQPMRKRGKWILTNGKTEVNCSACYLCSWSRSFEDTVRKFNFCPNCGADMRG